MASPSILSSHTNAVSGGPGAWASRRPRPASSSGRMALSRLIIGTRWLTGAKSVDGAAPTDAGWRLRGDQLGLRGLDGAQLAHQVVVLGVGDLRAVQLVVALVVVDDQGAELLGTGHRSPAGIRRVRRHETTASAPPAVHAATPIR